MLDFHEGLGGCLAGCQAGWSIGWLARWARTKRRKQCVPFARNSVQNATPSSEIEVIMRVCLPYRKHLGTFLVPKIAPLSMKYLQKGTFGSAPGRSPTLWDAPRHAPTQFLTKGLHFRPTPVQFLIKGLHVRLTLK